jgi:hypothetical protein
VRTATHSLLLSFCTLLLPYVIAVAHAQFDGAIHLRTGFVPDPTELTGEASGRRDAGDLEPSCRGFVGAQPNHLLALDSRFGFLRIFATGPGDLVLAVRTADDRWLCNDDRFGRHPSVEGFFPPGPTEVWVGVAQAGAQSAYTLRITEMRSVRPGIGPAAETEESIALARELGLEVESAEGLHGNIRLPRGFLPDPRWLEGVAGGAIDVGSLGGSCRGQTTPRPTYVIQLETEFDFLQLYVRSTAEQELTVLVLTPDGRFLCDTETADVASVEANRWVPGHYRVWVGVAAEDTTVPHRLGISEVRRVR